MASPRSQTRARVFSATIVALLCACSRSPSTTTTTSAAGDVGPAGGKTASRETECHLVEDGFGPAGSARVHAEVFVEGLEVPWSVAFLPSGEMLVTERAGRIRLVRGRSLVADPVATVQTARASESGLLGLALHPRFSENRAFYVYFTFDKGDRRVNRIARYVLDEANPPHAREERLVFDDIPASPLHDGGRLRFGPDGMLYVGTGDARVPDSAQDLSSTGGKILRLTPDGQVPADNPFQGKPLFVYGVRNVQAFDFLDDGRVVIADHGPSGEFMRHGGDEVSVASAGQNLGWPGAWRCDRKANVVTPLLVFEHAAPPGGGLYYRGDAIPAWKDSFLFATLASRHLHRVAFDAERTRATVSEVYFEGERPRGYGRLRDVVAGPDGAVYVTTSNCDGRGECPATKDAILRITADER